MGKQGIVLKYHGNIPLDRRQVGDILGTDFNHARSRGLQPGDHSQGGRFTTPGGAEQYEQVSLFAFEIYGVQGREVAPTFGNIFYLDC
jgi:hypothetical protein